MLCKNAYEKKSERTKKNMILCKLKGENADLSQLCISQRFCAEKGKYIPNDQKRNCKYYECK